MFGGFLLADANDGSYGRGFDASFRRDLARVLPGAPLEPVPATHVVFKSFFLLDSAPGRLLLQPWLRGGDHRQPHRGPLLAERPRRSVGARRIGGVPFEVSPGGEAQREPAVRVGINVCMYALCLDYKDDAVHLPLILKRRR